LRPSPQQLTSIGRSVVDALVRCDLVELPANHEPAIAAVAERFDAYFKAAAALEAEAERLADEHLRGAGRAGAGLDRRRVVQMIQAKIAKERNFPL
jgi:hypothetical protein